MDYVLVEHTWTQTVTAPTCTEAGYTLNGCSCGNVYQSDPVSALGHDYTEAITEDQEVFTCTRCGHSYSQDHDHAYTQSHVVPPTCAFNGYTVYTCVCGDTTTGDSVPALGHNYQETSRDTYWVYYACTRCGATAQEPIVAPPVEVSVLSEESELVEGCIEYEPVDVQTVHEYIYASGKLLRETITTSVEGTLTDTTVLDFYYDQNGRPYSFTCDGEEYFYILNLQGDVVAICDESCNALGSYIYNAWGEITIQSGTIAEINPIRYRGYYYDSELEMYYLQSRYYDPSICRFINADGYASTGQGFAGYNMFAYCYNSPMAYSDELGRFPVWLIPLLLEGLSSAVMSFIAEAASGGNLASALLAATDSFAQQLVFAIPGLGDVIEIAVNFQAIVAAFNNCKAAGATDQEALIVALGVCIVSLLPSISFKDLSGADEIVGALLADFGIDFLPQIGLVAMENTVNENAQTRQANAVPLQNKCTNDVYDSSPSYQAASGGGMRGSNRVVYMM